MYTLFVGADISSKTIELHWQQAETGETGHRQINQSETDYQRLIKRLSNLASPEQTVVLMEATGTYWLRFALAIHVVGFDVMVIAPQRAHYFAKSRLQRAKSDAIDAQLLCDMAQLAPTPLWTPPPAVYHDLQQRLSLRDDYQKSCTQYRNRRSALRYDPNVQPEILASLNQTITFFASEVKRLSKEIEALLNADHEWYQAAQRLLSIKGIGTITTATILTATHAFQCCETPEQAASFAGLVPHERSSGQWQGKRYISGGNAQLRSMLYLAAGYALQHNPPIRDFYIRLVQRGKIKQVARIAAARKLIHIAWACVTKNQDFDPNYGQHTKVA